MLKELKYGAAREDRQAWITEAERMVQKYHWENECVVPYLGCPTKLTEIIDQMRHYDEYTSDSKDILIELANGTGGVMNHWEEWEQKPRVTVRLKNGKVKRMPKDMADYMGDMVEVIA